MLGGPLLPAAANSVQLHEEGHTLPRRVDERRRLQGGVLLSHRYKGGPVRQGEVVRCGELQGGAVPGRAAVCADWHAGGGRRGAAQEVQAGDALSGGELRGDAVQGGDILGRPAGRVR